MSGDEGCDERSKVMVVWGSERGLRQESPLSPLLFNIYTMEMVEGL